MATIVPTRQPAGNAATFFSRLLDRCIELLPYMALPGYYPASHAYHFRGKEPASAPFVLPDKKTFRLPRVPFHR